MPTLLVTNDDFEKAQAAFQVWDMGNNVLYKLCSDNPRHGADDEVAAKTWLIGRAYAVSLERRSGFDNSDKFYVEHVIPALKNSNLDQQLTSLRGHNREIQNSLKVHKLLVDSLRSISKTGIKTEDRRSFASKYLHFHIPNHFFIYDSRAISSIKKLTGRLDLLSKRLPTVSDFDEEYADFFDRCERLCGHISAVIGRKPTPRELDNVLLFHHARPHST